MGKMLDEEAFKFLAKPENWQVAVTIENFMLQARKRALNDLWDRVCGNLNETIPTNSEPQVLKLDSPPYRLVGLYKKNWTEENWKGNKGNVVICIELYTTKERFMPDSISLGVGVPYLTPAEIPTLKSCKDFLQEHVRCSGLSIRSDSTWWFAARELKSKEDLSKLPTLGQEGINCLAKEMSDRVLELFRSLGETINNYFNKILT